MINVTGGIRHWKYNPSLLLVLISYATYTNLFVLFWIFLYTIFGRGIGILPFQADYIQFFCKLLQNILFALFGFGFNKRKGENEMEQPIKIRNENLDNYYLFVLGC